MHGRLLVHRRVPATEYLPAQPRVLVLGCFLGQIADVWRGYNRQSPTGTWIILGKDVGLDGAAVVGD